MMDPEMAANPQPMFKALREAMPVMPVEGVGVVLTRRAEIDEAFRNPEIFSSNMSAGRPREHPPADPAADRPARPQEVPQDPRPALRAAADGAARGAGHRAGQRPHRRVRRPTARSTSPRSSRCRSRRRCSSRCSACRSTSCRAFLTMKDGIIRPDHVVGEPRRTAPRRDAYQQAIGRLDLRLLRRACSTSARSSGRDDLLSRFLDAEVDGRALDPRGHPRHLLPLPHRRPRHRHRHRSTACSPTSPQHPEQRQQLVDDPSLIPAGGRGAAALGDAGDGRRARRRRRHRDRRLPDRRRASMVMVAARRGQHRRGRVRRRRRGALRPRGQPPPRVRRRRAPLPRLAPRPPRAARRAARVAPPHPRVRGDATATSSSTRRHPLASSTFPMVFTAAG